LKKYFVNIGKSFYAYKILALKQRERGETKG